MLSGDFQDPHLIANMFKSYNSTPISKEEYIKKYLSEAIKKFRGRKRLRKKKAVKHLELKWRLSQFIKPLYRRTNYSEIGRALFSVEPLPEVTPYYIQDLRLED